MKYLIDRQALLEEYDRLHVGEPGRARKMIEDAPSVQPEKRTEERTETHACDSISRQEAIDEIGEWIKAFLENGHKESAADARLIQDGIIQLPSAQPDLNEWCTDCKEYDSEKHHCPRFNRVIREALKDIKDAHPERKPGKWEFIGDNMFECTNCEVVYTTNQLNGLRNYDTDPYAPKFCPNCGADMREKYERLD